jgi:hypothetical protein
MINFIRKARYVVYLLLVFGVLLSGFTTRENNVSNILTNQKLQDAIICTGKYAYAFHSRTNCPGLNNCQGKLISLSINDAVNSYNRKPCCRCWSNVNNNCHDDSGNNTQMYDSKPLNYRIDYDRLFETAKKRGELENEVYKKLVSVKTAIYEVLSSKDDAWDLEYANELKSIITRINALTEPNIDLLGRISDVNKINEDFEIVKIKHLIREVARNKEAKKKEEVDLYNSKVYSVGRINDYVVTFVKETPSRVDLLKEAYVLSEAIKVLPSMEYVIVIGYQNGYWKVLHDNNIGYVIESFLKIKDDMERFKK